MRVRRHQVEPAAGLTIGCVIWLFTRLRWQAREDRAWAVELSAIPDKRWWVLSTLVERSIWPDKPSALNARDELIAAVEAGTWDARPEE